MTGYVFGVRIGGRWVVRVGAARGEGETFAIAMRNALMVRP